MRADSCPALTIYLLLMPLLRNSTLVVSTFVWTDQVLAQTPVLNVIFPPSGQIGKTVDVTISGSNLEGLQSLQCSIPNCSCEALEVNRFRLTIPNGVMPGQYDLWAVGVHGVSAPRTFVVGNRSEQCEVEPSDSNTDAMLVPINSVINGRIEKPGDVDSFRFQASKGQRVVIECAAERIDSVLRVVLEVFDASGKRLAVNRGYFGTDPLIDFLVPEDGTYIVKIQDLISSGSPEHYYRLDIDTGPRVAFTVPAVIERGKTSRVALYGWNLSSTDATVETLPSPSINDFSRIDVDIQASAAAASWPLPIRLGPSQAALSSDAFPFYFPGSHAPVLNGLTDVPVSLDRIDNHSTESAQIISVPTEISGQLIGGRELDWYAFDAKSGEVFYFEALGQRISSPVDLQISIVDGRARQSNSNAAEDSVVLAQFADETRNIGGAFSTSHLDPAGRWVCPADGRFLIAIQNKIGGLQSDPRRVYRLNVRREEPDFQVVAIPQNGVASSLNIPRGGRAVLELLALRQRGFDGPIRVSAKDLPSGVECPDVWLGRGVDRTTLVLSAENISLSGPVDLKLEASAEIGGVAVRRQVRCGTIVRTGTPTGWGRLTSVIPLSISGVSPLRITANGHETVEHQLYGTLHARHSPGGVVDIAIQVDRTGPTHQAPVKLMGIGLPDLIPNQTALIPAGKEKGYLSFELPTTLPVGQYSLTVRAETTTLTADGKTETSVVYSNPVTIDVQPAAFVVDVDPFAVKRARRGETIQIAYTARRQNGFIGKMHTELAAPGCVTNVEGLRGRGETFTGQTEYGSLQIIVNDDAPLGPQKFVRLFTVGVVEDEPVFHGSRFLSLEVVE